MHNLRSIGAVSVWIVVLAMAFVPSQAPGETLRACVGTGLPDISSGSFDCTTAQIVPGTGEAGNFFFLDLESTDPSLLLTEVSLDFDPSADADIDSRGAFFADHLDGATLAGENLVSNLFSATFANFGSAVDLFYLGFDFDKRSFAGGGTPLGADYVGGTLTATTNDGTVYVCELEELDSLGAVAEIPCDLVEIADDDGFSLCLAAPPLCPEPELREDIVLLDCPVIGCEIADWLPRNCFVKWTCPGCPPQGLCPPWYHIELDGLGEAWLVGLFDREGRAVPHRRSRTKTGIVLSFRPTNDHYLEGQIGNYFLNFKMTKKGKPATQYKIRTRLETSDSPMRRPRKGKTP